MAALADRGAEGVRSTCRRALALAQNPIITSKLDSAGADLGDSGAQQRMKHCMVIEENLICLADFTISLLYSPWLLSLLLT